VFGKRKKDLDSKSVHITVMHLHKVINKLEKSVEAQNSAGIDPWATEHDIKCLNKAIEYLEQG
jgi:hypothetical protein